MDLICYPLMGTKSQRCMLRRRAKGWQVGVGLTTTYPDTNLSVASWNKRDYPRNPLENRYETRGFGFYKKIMEQVQLPQQMCELLPLVFDITSIIANFADFRAAR